MKIEDCEMTGYGNPKSGKRSSLWIALAVFVVAGIIYFLFFTRTPDESTRTDVPLEPSAQSETPEPAPNAAPASDKTPTPAQAN